MADARKPRWRIGLVVLLALACASDRAFAQSPEIALLSEDPIETELARARHAAMWAHLARSEAPWIKTSAALYYIRFAETELRPIGEQLLLDVLSAEPTDAHTLWLLRWACNSYTDIAGCASARLGERLVAAAPDNAAAHLALGGFIDGYRPASVPDNEHSRQALQNAARASSFDTYDTADAAGLYRELLDFEQAYQQAPAARADAPAVSRAFADTWTVNNMQPMMAYGGILDLCEAQVHEGRNTQVEACHSIARTMQESGRSLMTRAIGYGLERRLLEAGGGDEAEALHLARKARMSTFMVVECQKPAWMFSPDEETGPGPGEIERFVADLETVGEAGAIRNAAIRDYAANPGAYDQDPALCDRLMDLDSEAMGELLGEMDPARRYAEE